MRLHSPGMGKSTDVPLHQRVAVWVELVPQLLAHLGIKHVSLVSHSAGTIYLLNTLYHYRSILHPEKPFVALLGKSMSLTSPILHAATMPVAETRFKC